MCGIGPWRRRFAKLYAATMLQMAVGLLHRLLTTARETSDVAIIGVSHVPFGLLVGFT